MEDSGPVCDVMIPFYNDSLLPVCLLFYCSRWSFFCLPLAVFLMSSSTCVKAPPRWSFVYNVAFVVFFVPLFMVLWIEGAYMLSHLERRPGEANLTSADKDESLLRRRSSAETCQGRARTCLNMRPLETEDIMMITVVTRVQCDNFTATLGLLLILVLP